METPSVLQVALLLVATTTKSRRNLGVEEKNPVSMVNCHGKILYIYDHKPMEPNGYKLLVSVLLLFFVYISCSLQIIWEYMTLTMLNIGNMRYDHQPIDVHDWLYTYDRLMYYYY